MNTLIPPFNPFEDHFMGATNAPVEVLRYGDFQCEHCADVYPAIQSLKEVMGSRMRVVYRHFPQPEVYPLALDTAAASEVAGFQNKFWSMYDMLYLNQKYLVRSSISHFAEVLRIDMRLYENTSDYRKLVRKVIRDFESGVKNGIDETPTFFINGKRYNGIADFENLCKYCCKASDYYAAYKHSYYQLSLKIINELNRLNVENYHSERKSLGLHYVTAIAGDAQRNNDFYAGVMGLRFVKKTANFDDLGTYHFYFGDRQGTPGTILSFLPWGKVERGYAGSGMITEIGFSVPSLKSMGAFVTKKIYDNRDTRLSRTKLILQIP